MKELIYDVTIRNGTLPRVVSDAIRQVIRSREGKTLRISLKPIERRRSCQQNRFYWGVVIPCVQQMFEDAGYSLDMEQVHQYLKEYVGDLTEVVYGFDGKKYRIAGSSAGLSKMKFETYLQKIRVWAAQFDVVIPHPHEFN